MADMEKVIRKLQEALEDAEEDGKFYVEIRRPDVFDAISLLKEQDLVKPHYNARTNWYECGACHYSMTSGMHCRGELIPAYKANYCAKCGKGVMWND